jgi:hypothetical protein
MGVRGASRRKGGIFAMAVFAAFIDFFLKLGSYDRSQFAVLSFEL